MNFWLTNVANMPLVLAPAATFGIYAIQAAILGTDSLDTIEAFTSLALISLVSHPASRLLSAIPNTAASIGCFDRIQEFLLTESLHDSRLVTASEDQNSNDLNHEVGQATLPESVILVEDATIKPSITADSLLRNMSFLISKGSFTVIAGPVGAGKTTLLKTLLGEIECSVGTITVLSRQIAYCSQIPWLINGSIRDSICGYRNDDIDQIWYQTVLSACELTYDISKFSAGDQTVIGSRGVALSGGQKHRIAIARAVYSRADTFILDDVLSALDKRTETSIVSKLFDRDGPSGPGLLRRPGCTVILVSHSCRFLVFLTLDTSLNFNSSSPVPCGSGHHDRSCWHT